MFERYSEHARRAIFFARYEASVYGSPYIETEHLLLGILREGPLLKWFPEKADAEREIRAEIEKRITRRERFSTSVEVPLSTESGKILNLAGEISEKLGHQCIEREHLLIAIFSMENSLAAQVLRACALKPGTVHEQLGKAVEATKQLGARISARIAVQNILIAITSLSATEFLKMFTSTANVVDASGKRWEREELNAGFETVFAYFVKKNTSYEIESFLANSPNTISAIVLWKNAILASEERTWMHRMALVLISDAGDWKIQLLQVTPVKSPLGT